ncbi:tetratricopeptide repeat protein [Amycolatopsis sp. K13G38]|uniref:Tetratricopeptide repeat protein n=2 Tax=Amycolatopsis acididurans TaxID=2724524 RepID=A0ABX1J0L9_9PSEU|nr:tetratricopeptide repeat protein [Amycolatopsis acididurans]
MRTHAAKPLPEGDNLLRRWKSWELGENKPGPHYAPLIAATLGTVSAALFPPVERTESGLTVLTATGMDTMEIVSRLQASDINDATLEGLRITVEKLCSEYPYMPPETLIPEGRQWLRRIVEMQDQRLSFRQRRQTLELAGWLALLVGCLEYDLGDRRSAEATRKMALSLGQDVGSGGILGWAHEMRAWFALTSGDYRGVLAAAEAGQVAAGNHSVGVQLIAQEAKAWARLGRKDEMERALERGRVMLEAMPYPDNTDNHFVVDPAKYDFYVMDCYRHIGEDRLAETLAQEVIRSGTDFNGDERKPMRVAEARITLGVAAAREGDLDEALTYGRRAIEAPRKSLPSIALVSQDLASVLAERYNGQSDADEYRHDLMRIQQGR